MASASYLPHFGQKSRRLSWRLTLNQWLSKINIAKVNIFRKPLDHSINRTANIINDMISDAHDIYKSIDNIDAQEAKQHHAKIINFRKKLTEQNKYYKSIEYADNEQLRINYHKLVRLTNRLEARIKKKAYSDNTIIKTSAHIKEKIASNSKKSATNALLKEANHRSKL